jgi:hypothetical protein
VSSNRACLEDWITYHVPRFYCMQLFRWRWRRDCERSTIQRNSTLETLRLLDNELDESAYETLTSVLLVNTSLTELATLKRLWLHPNLKSFGEDEMKQVISLVKQNFGLENLDEGLSVHDTTGELGTILRLNQAGRRYLIEDAASIAKGVEVLVAVRDDLGCLFYHLLENPLLCDIEHLAEKAATIADGPVRSNPQQCTSK